MFIKVYVGEKGAERQQLNAESNLAIIWQYFDERETDEVDKCQDILLCWT